jgi:hypothetical protein
VGVWILNGMAQLNYCSASAWKTRSAERGTSHPSKI